MDEYNADQLAALSEAATDMAAMLGGMRSRLLEAGFDPAAADMICAQHQQMLNSSVLMDQQYALEQGNRR